VLLHCCLNNSENDRRQQQSSNEAETNTQHVSALFPLILKRPKSAATKEQQVSALLPLGNALKLKREVLCLGLVFSVSTNETDLGNNIGETLEG
jgi:hypothetical protein